MKPGEYYYCNADGQRIMERPTLDALKEALCDHYVDMPVFDELGIYIPILDEELNAGAETTAIFNESMQLLSRQSWQNAGCPKESRNAY